MFDFGFCVLIESFGTSYVSRHRNRALFHQFFRCFNKVSFIQRLTYVVTRCSDESVRNTTANHQLVSNF
ncbi:Uncharacterised protein [Vibrio cholerae]|nr:Uncharacterised protein [Vibrio cholerae]CSI79608.1 Uncharacterised protein [Vibrio cholerae]